MKKLLVFFLFLITVFFIVACQQEVKEPVAKTPNGTLTLDQLGKVQPGLGEIMMQVGERFTAANFAAEAGNWDLTQYELDELKEVMEVGEITRPKRKEALSNFLDGPFKKIEAAAKNKNLAEFQATFNETIEACNGCHKAAGKPFIEYTVPDTFSGDLKISP